MIDIDLRRLINRLNTYARRALESAAGLAVSRGHYEVSIEHVLLVFLEDTQHDVQAACRHFEVDVAGFKRRLQAVIETFRSGNQGRPVFSPLLVEWLTEAWLIGSVEFSLDQCRSGALFAAIFARPNRFGDDRWLTGLEAITYDRFKSDFLAAVAGSQETTAAAVSGGGDPSQATAVPGIGGDTALARFCTNFTEQARSGKIDAVFTRDREIQQMIDILGRRRKNNPICVGEPGVGKTAVVEGLALKIAEGDVPDFLKDVELIGMDLGMLQAGAGVKGEFESRLKGIIDEVKASPKPIVLFIDEAHMLIGAGGAAGGADAANLLKPALARGELRTVAATTWSEYKKYFEKDPALARRFQLVKLDEPSPDQAITILRGLRKSYEKAHGVYIRDSAVEAAAKMSARYISGRQLPDKAVDVLDTACARVKLSLSSTPPVIELKQKRVGEQHRALEALRRDHHSSQDGDQARIEAIEQDIAALEAEIDALVAKRDQELALVHQILGIRGKLGLSLEGDKPAEPAGEDQVAAEETAGLDEEALRAQFREAADKLKKIQKGNPLVAFEVTEDIVGQVIAEWTGIPLGNMVKDEAQSILTLSENLKGRVIGQDQAIEAIDHGVRVSKAGLQNPDAPMGVFLFVGPSGVGKTELATAIADQLFGGERFLISINMSEFQEKHTVSKLVGSPPGYVGYGEGGVLTEAVRQRPYSVVLLDEVEKADLEVMNVFYQVFDKGMLSDGEGRLIDFKNTIVVLTSNLATDLLTELGTREARPSVEELVEAIRPTLSAHFKPALLARMQIIPFYPLIGAPLEKIVRLKLNKVGKRLRESQKMEFSYDDAVVSAIAARCTEVETGARNINHIVNRTILPELATELLSNMGDDSKSFSGVTINVGEQGQFVYRLS
ncbi:type VI secretion system protein VasG [Pseudorhizobium tarimense]|uniref:Type VI secretion system protein VasG n=1 Tax=Pseudorhizobium tarimense TaxID=1079109 RepID=A0ABV2H504_9HYPH|nr:type VI secretion system ATPase TssH [Pseudorhizobium tarimense]MCJ8518569.1 type VI secretion system ATPase TssH [Pseudorhizobium tarimense]